jgi:cell division protein FtsB
VRDMKIKKQAKWAAIVCFFLIFYFHFILNNIIINLYATHLNLKKKQQEVERKRREIDSLIIETKKLKNDTAYMEKIAREKLGMAKKNEKVFKFIEGK